MTRLRRTAFLTACALAVGGAMTTTPYRADAQDFFIGEIIQNGYNFCPSTTLPAAGQVLPISSYQSLYALIGTIFGGDGISTFALPDLRGRTPAGAGIAPGLDQLILGQASGSETVTLTESNLPAHNHEVRATSVDGINPGPGSKLLAGTLPGGLGDGDEAIYAPVGPLVTMSDQMITSTGGSQPLEIQDPFLVTNFCIVTDGIFPPRQ